MQHQSNFKSHHVWVCNEHQGWKNVIGVWSHNEGQEQESTEVPTEHAETTVVGYALHELCDRIWNCWEKVDIAVVGLRKEGSGKSNLTKGRARRSMERTQNVGCTM